MIMEGNFPHTLDVVSFVAGGSHFAVEAEQVLTQLPAGPYEEALSAEHLLGLCADNTHQRRRVLLMKCGTGDYAMTVSEPVELRSLKTSVIHPLPLLIAARNTITGIRGLAMEADGVTVLVDISVINTHM